MSICEQTALFVGGQEGYNTYRIPALCVSRPGTVLAFCEGRKYEMRDHGEVHLLRRSFDGGQTWTSIQAIVEEKRFTCGTNTNKQKSKQTMKKPVNSFEFLSAIALLVLAVGCASTQSKENMLAAGTGIGGENFLKNGGFEDESTPTVSQFMQGWLTYGTPASEVATTDAEHHTGRHALKVSKNAAFCYDLPLHKERDYTLSFWVKANEATPRLSMDMKDRQRQNIPGLTDQSNFDWKRVDIPLPASNRNDKGYAYLGFQITLGASQTGKNADGAAWFDDVEILDAYGKNLVPNPSFEEPAFEIRNYPGWTAYAGQAYGSVKTGFAVVTRDTAVKHGGNASLRVACNNNQTRISNYVDLDPLRGKGIKKLRVSGWLRCEGMGERSAQIRLAGFKESEVTLASVSEGTGWTRGEAIADLGTMDKSLSIILSIPEPAPGVVWFDDIVVEEATGDLTVNLLRNTLFRQCFSHPRQPDYWGVRWGPNYVRDWTHENFGLTDKEASPVPGAQVLQLFNPPERDTIMPVYYWFSWTPLPNLPAGEYTFSVYLKAKREGTPVKFSNPSGKVLAAWKAGPEWKRFAVTGAKEDISSGLELPAPDSMVWVAAPQLEAGGTATAYRPAPNESAGEAAGKPADTVKKPRKADVPPPAAAGDADLLVSGLPLAAYLEYDFHTDDREARGRVDWNRGQAATMRAALHDAHGAVVKDTEREWAVAGPCETNVYLPLKGLKDGVYEWRTTATVAGEAPIEAKDRLIKLAPSTVEVRANRFTRGIEINRAPFFPVFLPKTPGNMSNAEIALLKAQGFNCMANGVMSLSAVDILKHGLSPEKLKAIRGHLDRLDTAGLKFIFVFWEIPDLFEASELKGNIENFIKVNTTVVNALKDHPAIIAWYLLDEMDTRWEDKFGYKEADIEALRDAVRAADPYRPAYINFNHLWMTEPFGKLQATDIISLDQYPFGDPISMDLDRLVPAPRLINNLTQGRKPSFIWIHGSYGPPEIPREPRPYEMRVQGWLYLVYGTRGLGYWAERPLNPELWQEQKELNRACVFLSENAFGPPEARQLKLAVQKQRIHYAVWMNGAKGYVFGVSTADKPVNFAIAPEKLFKRPVKAVRRLFEDGQVGIDADGVLKDVFPPAQRRAYEFDLMP